MNTQLKPYRVRKGRHARGFTSFCAAVRWRDTEGGILEVFDCRLMQWQTTGRRQ